MMTIQKCRKYQLNCGDTFVLCHSNRIWFDSPFFPSHSWLDIKRIPHFHAAHSYPIWVHHSHVLNAPVKHSNGEFLNCLRRLTPTKNERQKRNSTKQAENSVLRIRNWRRSEKSFLVCYTFAFAFHFDLWSIYILCIIFAIEMSV